MRTVFGIILLIDTGGFRGDRVLQPSSVVVGEAVPSGDQSGGCDRVGALEK